MYDFIMLFRCQLNIIVISLIRFVGLVCEVRELHYTKSVQFIYIYFHHCMCERMAKLFTVHIYVFRSYRR